MSMQRKQRSTRARVLVMAGRGLNCEVETFQAFQLVGIEGDIVHVDDILGQSNILDSYQIMVVPGGFSFGDHTGAGKALANRLKDEFMEPFRRFMERGDTLALGICNGCQALLKSDLWTADENLARSVTLTANASGAYLCRWVDVALTDSGRQSAWFSRVCGPFQIPIAHGEGRFILGSADHTNANHANANHANANHANANHANANDTIALQYDGMNPNGSDHKAAALIGYEGRLLAMMPHPERAVRFTQQPEWTAMRETLRREGQEVPPFGPGYSIFDSAAAFFE